MSCDDQQKINFKFLPSGLIYSYLQSEIEIYFIQVDGNGRLVPATDDELMEVEGLLENEKRETHIVADTRQALGCISNEVSPSGMPQLESSEGMLSLALHHNNFSLH